MVVASLTFLSVLNHVLISNCFSMALTQMVAPKLDANSNIDVGNSMAINIDEIVANYSGESFPAAVCPSRLRHDVVDGSTKVPFSKEILQITIIQVFNNHFFRILGGLNGRKIRRVPYLVLSLLGE